MEQNVTPILVEYIALINSANPFFVSTDLLKCINK